MQSMTSSFKIKYGALYFIDRFQIDKTHSILYVWVGNGSEPKRVSTAPRRNIAEVTSQVASSSDDDDDDYIEIPAITISAPHEETNASKTSITNNSASPDVKANRRASTTGSAKPESRRGSGLNIHRVSGGLNSPLRARTEKELKQSRRSSLHHPSRQSHIQEEMAGEGDSLELPEDCRYLRRKSKSDITLSVDDVFAKS